MRGNTMRKALVVILACTLPAALQAQTGYPYPPPGMEGTVIGPDIVTNGGFGSGVTSWTGTNWVASGSKALHQTGSTAALTQTLTVTTGVHYRITYTVSGVTAGSITASMGGVTGTAVSGNGTQVENFTAQDTTTLALTPTTGFDGSIDDVSVTALTFGRLRVEGETVLFGPLTIHGPLTSVNAGYPSTGGGGYATVDDEDTPLTQRTTLNFEGAGVSCVDNTDQTTCTIAGGITSPGAGILADTVGDGTLAARTIQAGTAGVVTNGNAVAGDPTVGPDLTTTPQQASDTADHPATCGDVGDAFQIGYTHQETDTGEACTCSGVDTWSCVIGIAVSQSDTSTAGYGFVIDEDTMASDSATKVPTQQSVKAYVDASGGAFNGNVTDQFSLQADITPAQITGDQNNYTGCTVATNAVCRLSSDTTRAITGIVNGADGRVLVLVNVGSFNIALVDESASSTDINRISIIGSGNYLLQPGYVMTLIYDSTLTRWKLLGHPLTSGTLIGNVSNGDACTDTLCVDAAGVANRVSIFGSTNQDSGVQIGTTSNAKGNFYYVGGGTSFGYAVGAFRIYGNNNSTSVQVLGGSGVPLIMGAGDQPRSYVAAAPKTLTESSATSFVQIALTAGQMTGGRISYTVEAAEAAEFQALSGDLRWAAVNKAATETCPDPTDIGTALLAASSSTLTCTWTCDETPTNAVNIQANCVSGLAQTTLRINYAVYMDGAVGVITPQ